MNFTAVIFDLGGVVISSPMQAFANAEREQGLAPNFINHMIVSNGHDGAWGKLERGEIAMNGEFFSQFDEELAAAGEIGSLANNTQVVMGLMPNIAPLIEGLIPSLVAKFKSDSVEAALLVPS